LSEASSPAPFPSERRKAAKPASVARFPSTSWRSKMRQVDAQRFSRYEVQRYLIGAVRIQDENIVA
jgi:hypothetical protein